MITVEERPIDPKIDRVWFLYVVDETEGPFTVKEIRDKIKNSEAKSSSYVWRDGLADWTILSTLAEFDTNTKSATIVRGATQDSPKTKTITSLNTKHKTITEIKTVKEKSSLIEKVKGTKKPMEEKNNKTLLWGFLIFVLIAIVVYQGVASGMLDPILEKANVKEKVHSMNLPSLLPTSHSGQPSNEPSGGGISDKIGSMLRGNSFIMEKIVPKMPQKIRIWLSPVEIPFDVQSTDIVALREAAAEPITRGARIAVSLPIKYITQPQFIITTNLPNGVHFDLRLIGKSGTLINALGYEAKSSAVVTEHLARSTPFINVNNKPFPIGEYTLLIYESDNQTPAVQTVLGSIPHKTPPSIVPQNKMVFSVDTFFIGGNKDQNYQAQLSQYNEKLRIQVPAETLELKQLHATIESMANESAIKFFKLSNRKLTKKDKLEWTQYSNNYKKMSLQMQNQYFAQLPQNGGEKYSNKIFGDVFKKAEATFMLSETLHAKECLFFEKKANMDEIKKLAAQTLTAIKDFQKIIAESLRQN